ncbi:hypothetical protein GCM10009670_30760 [Citricoccus alkalitolerans]
MSENGSTTKATCNADAASSFPVDRGTQAPKRSVPGNGNGAQECVVTSGPRSDSRCCARPWRTGRFERRLAAGPPIQRGREVQSVRLKLVTSAAPKAP